jgi:hypothetical protein
VAATLASPSRKRERLAGAARILALADEPDQLIDRIDGRLWRLAKGGQASGVLRLAGDLVAASPLEAETVTALPSHHGHPLCIELLTTAYFGDMCHF